MSRVNTVQPAGFSFLFQDWKRWDGRPDGEFALPSELYPKHVNEIVLMAYLSLILS